MDDQRRGRSRYARRRRRQAARLVRRAEQPVLSKRNAARIARRRRRPVRRPRRQPRAEAARRTDREVPDRRPRRGRRDRADGRTRHRRSDWEATGAGGLARQDGRQRRADRAGTRLHPEGRCRRRRYRRLVRRDRRRTGRADWRRDRGDGRTVRQSDRDNRRTREEHRGRHPDQRRPDQQGARPRNDRVRADADDEASRAAGQPDRRNRWSAAGRPVQRRTDGPAVHARRLVEHRHVGRHDAVRPDRCQRRDGRAKGSAAETVA